MTAQVSASSRWLLGLAAVAVAFAAADTYVVVLALPDMMTSAGLSGEELQKAAPIISGFLLGYVAMLPLFGRIADLHGRVPVLVFALLLFAFGSLITAAAYDLPSLVTGRFLQGVGGGGLVPVTLALVADLYPTERRGLPLGVVGAVQELGSVLGPLFGALVLAVADWRAIFWINLAVGLVLAAAIARIAPRRAATRRRARHWCLLPGSVLAAAVALAGGLLVMWQPRSLVTSVDWGEPFVPFSTGGSRWASPLGVAVIAIAVILLVVLVARKREAARRLIHEADALGATLLAIALGGVIVAFATADPEVEVFSEYGPLALGISAVAAVLFGWRQRRARVPLIQPGTLARTPAWGAVAVSFLIGCGLIAALVDIPVFARITAYPDSQLKAALVLVEFLVALPIGAIIGGWGLRKAPAALIAAGGMALASIGFIWMSTWGPDALPSVAASVALVLTGFGFGLALAPVNHALLAATEPAVHGLASALLVVARMIGMLVGISALTTLGLRRFHAQVADLPPLEDLCAGSMCAAYSEGLQAAGIAQVEVIFLGAAAATALAAVLSLLVLRGSGGPTRPV